MASHTLGTGRDTMNLNIRPRFLLVPQDVKFDAAVLLRSAQRIVAAASGDTYNPLLTRRQAIAWLNYLAGVVTQAQLAKEWGLKSPSAVSMRLKSARERLGLPAADGRRHIKRVRVRAAPLLGGEA